MVVTVKQISLQLIPSPRMVAAVLAFHCMLVGRVMPCHTFRDSIGNGVDHRVAITIFAPSPEEWV